MRFKSTLILLILGLAAVFYFLLVERPRQARRDETSARQVRLTDVSADSVGVVTIERPDLTIEARRTGAHWVLFRPLEDSADDPSLNTLVRSICDAEIDRRIDTTGTGEAEYGLAAPAAVVRLGTENGRTLFELRIGDHNLTKSHCYAAVGASHTVLLVPAGIRRYALRPLFDFRNPRIVDVDLAEVTGIEISTPHSSMTWRRRAESEAWFTVQNGDTIAGDPTEVEALARRLRGLRAVDIPADTADASGYLTPVEGTITLDTARGPRAISLRFGGARGAKCYVEDSADGRVSEIDADVLGLFGKTLTDLRDRHLLRFTPSSLTRVSLETPEQTITIVKTGTRWSYANTGFGDLTDEAARRMLTLLENLRFETVIGETVPATGDFGFARPAYLLVLRGDAGRVIDELRVGVSVPAGDGRYVTSRSAPRLAAINEGSLSELVAILRGPSRS